MAEPMTTAVVGQDIGDVSNRWNFDSWSEKLDAFTAEDLSPGSASGSFGGGSSYGVAQNQIIKSGPLFMSSRSGFGWSSWRKRWFVLSKRALIFFKRDPSIQGGSRANMILGGIVLKSSGSVKVREDKKLLTILFPDVPDRRPFTLKTETFQDLHEWRTALEHALTLAPPSIIGSFCYWNAKPSSNSRVVRSPMSLSLQEADGSPSLLEKALCFLEEYGTKVEGILRISADLEEVQRRIKEFEQGKTEFDAKEDAHVVGDCVKHILRELPSSPVPVRCCNELLKAYEIEQSEAQINAFRMAIFKKLPEPNRLLFQRIVKMMYTISCTPENRMTPSALAACMAPLLLRPILAGECDLIDDIEFSDEDSSQLVVVANAARTAQAIIALILEEYHNIFSVDNSNRYSISVDSEEYGNEDSIDAEILKNINSGNLDAVSIPDWCNNENYELSSSEDPGRSSSFHGSDLFDDMDFSSHLTLSGSYDLPSSESQDIHMVLNNSQSGSSQHRKHQDQYEKVKKMQVKLFSTKSPSPNRKSNRSSSPFVSSLKPIFPSPEAETCPSKSPEEPRKSFVHRTLSSLWERDSAKKISFAESLDSHGMEK